MSWLERKREEKEQRALARERSVAQAAFDAAFSQWEWWRSTLQWMLDDARGFVGYTADDGYNSPIRLKKNEHLFAVFEGAHLIEPRRKPGQYVGRSSGVSFRIAKGVSYRVGQSSGTYVRGAEVPTPIDEGTAIVTDNRVSFAGYKQTREWQWSKLISLDHDESLPWTSLPVSNRQKTSGLLYDEQNTPLVRYRLEQGISHFEDRVDALVARLQHELGAHLAMKPVVPRALTRAT